MDPREFRHRFDDFFGKHIRDFKDDLFFLDQILEHAIGSGCLSSGFYKPASDSLNMRMLKDGWKSYFENTRVLAWTYVINPRELLHFIETNGQKHVKDMLAMNWDNIVARGRKRRAEKRAMDRKLKRVQALGNQGHPHCISYLKMGENDFIMARNAEGINGKLNCDKLLVFP